VNEDLYGTTPPETEPPATVDEPASSEATVPSDWGGEVAEPGATYASGWDGDAWTTEEPEGPQTTEVLLTTAPTAAPVLATPRRSRAWLWAIPVALLVAACGYLVVQNRAAAATVDALTTRVPQLLLPPGAPNPLAAQLASVKEDAGWGNFLQAQKRAAAVQLPPGLQGEMPGTPEGPGPGDPTVPSVTPQAEAFFAAHADLERRFTQYADQARALRDQGHDVQPLRDLRQRILDAASGGDVKQVTALLDQFEQGLRGLGGAPRSPSGGGELQQVVGEFQKAFEQAERENRDPRAAVALMRQAEAAVQAGDRAKALEIARKALVAMQRAPRNAGGAPRRPGGPAGPLPGQAERVLQAAFQMLDQEERDLAITHQAVDQALSAQLAEDPGKAREVLATAREALVRIHDRRVDFSARLSGTPPTAGESRPPQAGEAPGPGPRPGTPAPRQLDIPREVLEQFSGLLDQVREMDAEEYQSLRQRIARRLIGAILGEPGAEGAWLTLPPGLTPEQRIREKLRAAEEPYKLRKQQGEDVTALEELLREVRQDLAAARLIAAEGKVDAVLRQLGLLPKEPPRPEPPPLSLEREPAPALPPPPAGSEGELEAGG
jgi:tetratricopeptide (TPR) repeat protein